MKLGIVIMTTMSAASLEIDKNATSAARNENTG